MINFKLNMPFYLMAFYGSIMIALVLMLRALLKNKLPKFVFPVLWCVILVRLLVPFSVSSPLSMKVPDFFMSSPFEASAVTEAVQEDVLLVEGNEYASVPNAQIDESTAFSFSETPPTEHTYSMSGNMEEASSFQFQNLLSGFYGYRPHSVIILIYVIGLIGTSGILLFQKYTYTKRLRDSLLVEHNETINALLRERDMGHVLVFTNDQIASPLVCGLIAPKIYLPTRMNFSNTELLRHILCHETMHIKRGDNRLKFVMLIALCVHWFNPLVWIMSRCMAADMETACDESVLRLYHDEDAKKSYAFSLLAMAITGNRPTLLYSAFSKTAVERRVQSVLRYKKAPVFLLALSVCFVLCGSVVFATGGQAPFDPYLTSFCSSDACRFGARVTLTRGASLGRNAERRAEQVIFEVMREDTSNDPDVLCDRIEKALAAEFHVEPGAFDTDMSLVLDREELYEEYAGYGLVRSDSDSSMLCYNGETIRRFSDEMLGRYQSLQKGTVDIVVIRDRLGYITDVMAFHEGDAEYDRRSYRYFY